MEPYYESPEVTLWHGDCLEVLRTLPDASVHSVVTDPPYGLEFMGKEWDAPWKADGSVVADPASVERARVIADTNSRLAQGYCARAAESTDAARLAFPAQELVREESRRSPRDWKARWAAAGGRLYGGRMAALKEDFAPLSDVRASGAYRLTVAANLLQRFWLETGDSKPGATPPLRLESLRPIRPGAPAQGARP